VNSFGDVVYLPFNLQTDYVADVDLEPLDATIQKTDETESIPDVSDTLTD